MLADSLAYLSEKGLYSFLGEKREGFCDACFTGRYPVAAAAHSERRQMKLFHASELARGNGRTVR